MNFQFRCSVVKGWSTNNTIKTIFCLSYSNKQIFTLIWKILIISKSDSWNKYKVSYDHSVNYTLLFFNLLITVNTKIHSGNIKVNIKLFVWICSLECAKSLTKGVIMDFILWTQSPYFHYSPFFCFSKQIFI